MSATSGIATVGFSKRTCLSAVDGRYYSKMGNLGAYLSEFGLMRNRVLVEIEYLIALASVIPSIGEISDKTAGELRGIVESFAEADFDEISEIERRTNHDVKAVEYYLQRQFTVLGVEHLNAYIHFGLTSQDINNVAYPLMVKGALEHIYLPRLEELVAGLRERGLEWLHIPMLARTHGQPATPTRVGKEFLVWVERLDDQISAFKAHPRPHQAKFGGAVGCFNAHYVAYPHVDWIQFANRFVASLGLHRQQYTTQIEHYDGLALLCHFLQRVNTILIDLCRDVWTYVSLDYFRQRVAAQEVGSSTMPHKVNPIDFENAEGNLGLANSLLGFFAEKLPISRLQRDLSDSTVLRNLGLPFGHSVLAFHSILTGLSKLQLNQATIERDLSANFVVVAEAIQTVLRREKVPDAYELLKAFTRTYSRAGWAQEDFFSFIDTLPVSDAVKEELKAITPTTFIGQVPLPQ